METFELGTPTPEAVGLMTKDHRDLLTASTILAEFFLANTARNEAGELELIAMPWQKHDLIMSMGAFSVCLDNPSFEYSSLPCWTRQEFNSIHAQYKTEAAKAFSRAQTD